jgi:hypothetical protein
MIFAFIFSGCQNTPTKFERLEKGRWDARVLFKDLRSGGKSQIVNTVILAKKPSQLRIEAISSLGQLLGTVTMDGNKFQMLSPSNKTLQEGPATKEAFDKFVGVALNPQLFVDVLFDLEPAGFACEKNAKGFLARCKNALEKTEVEWTDREVSRKKVLISSPSFSVQMQLQGFSTEVQAADEAFNIILPDGYKRTSFPIKR